MVSRVDRRRNAGHSSQPTPLRRARHDTRDDAQTAKFISVHENANQNQKPRDKRATELHQVQPFAGEATLGHVNRQKKTLNLSTQVISDNRQIITNQTLAWSQIA